MSTLILRQRRLHLSLLPLVALPAAGCGNSQSALETSGPVSGQIATAWWIMFAGGSAVTILVIALLTTAIWRARRGRGEAAEGGGGGADEASDAQRRIERRWIVSGGVVLPAVVLIPLFIYATLLLRNLMPDRREYALDIEVVARQWWWDVMYRDPGPHLMFRTANELHIPVGVPVRISLRSEDVIHSFWVPALAGKKDLVPGRTNLVWLQADTPGVYRGQCAEFCGMQHARMAFLVVAHDSTEFNEWRERERQPARSPADSMERAGLAIFEARGCLPCHDIRGALAGGSIGPDLTHIGSRLTLAAGTLRNNRANLGGWIADPQSIKPGALMPRVPLDGPELQALIRYLESLR